MEMVDEYFVLEIHDTFNSWVSVNDSQYDSKTEAEEDVERWLENGDDWRIMRYVVYREVAK